MSKKTAAKKPPTFTTVQRIVCGEYAQFAAVLNDSAKPEIRALVKVVAGRVADILKGKGS